MSDDLVVLLLLGPCEMFASQVDGENKKQNEKMKGANA
jgi:hypothetical protein